MTEPRLRDEIERVKSDYEPLLPIEQKLIWFTFAAGVILLVALVFVSHAFVQ
jgi:hypothetical protein